MGGPFLLEERVL